MSLFKSVGKLASRGLGAMFTGGLSETNLGKGLFKKVGDVYGNTMTLQPGGFFSSNDSRVGQPIVRSTMPKTSGTSYEELKKILQPALDSANQNIDSQYGEAMKKIRASQAARGVLRSGVSDYPTTELAKKANEAKGGVAGSLAQIFGNTESQRSLLGSQAELQNWLRQAGIEDQLKLADYISDLNKPSKLQQIFGGIGAAAPLLGAAFGPAGFAAGAGASFLPKLMSIFGSGGSGSGSNQRLSDFAF